jgi:hypothetical protein
MMERIEPEATMSVTTIVITDPELLAKLAAADDHIVFRTPAGEIVKIGRVIPDDTTRKDEPPIGDRGETAG